LTCRDSLLVGLLTMLSFIDLCVMHSTLLSTFNSCGQLVFSCFMIKWLFTRLNFNPIHWYSTFHSQVMNVSMHVALKTSFFGGEKSQKTNVTTKVNILWQMFFFLIKKLTNFSQFCVLERFLSNLLRFLFWFCWIFFDKMIEYSITPTP